MLFRGTEEGPRSPLRVAVVTFGAIVLLGAMLGLVLGGREALVGGHPLTRWLTGLAAAAAVVAYLVQHRRVPQK